MNLYSVETAAVTLHSSRRADGPRVASLGHLCVCSCPPAGVGQSLGAWGSNLSTCPSAAFPLSQARVRTGGFGGQISQGKRYKLLRYGSKEALMCVLAKNCKGVNPCLPAKGDSDSYTRPKSHSWRSFQLFSPILLFSRGIIFSRS